MSKVYMTSRIKFVSVMRSNESHIRANMDSDGCVSRMFLEGFSRTTGGKSCIPTWIAKDATRDHSGGRIFIRDLMEDPQYAESNLPANRTTSRTTSAE